MKIEQLSLFIENHPGTLNDVCRLLAENNINIRTLSLADTEQFGILRLLVDDYKKAQKVLSDAGIVVKVTEVLAIPVDDHVGGLAKLMEVIARHNLNVEYMYAFTFGKGDNAVMVFRFEDTERAVKELAVENIGILDGIKELFR
ncbi:MAG: ACT domain-containing protein [Victivallaceae bacterium]|nr:ACT domain-containing protein [Victivallaceae bacterium]